MKLFLHVHTRDRNYKPVMLRMRDAWEESKHPRGQPKNAGQFASGSSGSSSRSTSSEQQSAGPSTPATNKGKRFGPIFHKTTAPISSLKEFDVSKADPNAVWGKGIYATLNEGKWEAGHLKNGKVLKGYVKGDIIDLSKPLPKEDQERMEKFIGRKFDALPLLTLEKRYGSVTAGLKAAGYSAAIHEGPGGTGQHIVVFDPNDIEDEEQPVFRRMTPREEGTTTKEEPKQTETHWPEFHGLKVPKSFDLDFESSDTNYYKDKSGNNLELTFIDGTTFWDITDNKGMRLASGKDQEGLDKAIEKHSKPPAPVKQKKSSLKIPANVKVTTKAKTKTTFSGKDKEENAVGYAIDDDIRGRFYLLISEESDSWKVVRPGQTLGQRGEGQESLNQALSNTSPAKAIPKPETGSQADLAASELSKIRVEEAVTKYDKSEHSPENKKEAYHAIGRAVFDYMGIDKSVGFKVGEPYEFKVGDKTFMSGGQFSPTTNTVSIFTNNAVLNLDQLVSHEAMHAKFDAVGKAYRKETEELGKLNYQDYEKVEKPDGSIRDAYKDVYPLHSEMPMGFCEVGDSNRDKLEEDDGITDYSRAYWEAVKTGGARSDPMLAVNETLAEMAKLDREGSLHRLLWYKNSKTYKPLYKLIHKYYPMAVEKLQA